MRQSFCCRDEVLGVSASPHTECHGIFPPRLPPLVLSSQNVQLLNSETLPLSTHSALLAHHEDPEEQFIRLLTAQHSCEQYFCSAIKAKCYIGITLSVILLSVRWSVRPSCLSYLLLPAHKSSMEH